MKHLTIFLSLLLFTSCQNSTPHGVADTCRVVLYDMSGHPIQQWIGIDGHSVLRVENGVWFRVNGERQFVSGTITVTSTPSAQ